MEIDHTLHQQPATGVVGEAHILRAGEDCRVETRGFATFLIPANTERVFVTLGDRQATPECGPKDGGAHLTESAAPFLLGAVLDDRVALHKAILRRDRAKVLVERERAARRDEDAVHLTCARLNVGNSVLLRFGEGAEPQRNLGGNAEAGQVCLVYGRR